MLISDANKKFGSLKNALIFAGLSIENPENSVQPQIRNKEKPTSVKKIQKPKNKFRSYPNEYFLNMLKINRYTSGYSTREGAPKWWEKKAGKVYLCSSCRNSIQKTERYIGKKTLTPGQKGIYGHRGTYHTYYFHIVCLLKETRDNTQKQIEQIGWRIKSREENINRLKDEINVKTAEIEKNKGLIQEKDKEYQNSSRLAKIGKWVGYKLAVGNLENIITKLTQRIKTITYDEIPNNRRIISEKMEKRNQEQVYLKHIITDLTKIE